MLVGLNLKSYGQLFLYITGCNIRYKVRNYSSKKIFALHHTIMAIIDVQFAAVVSNQARAW